MEGAMDSAILRGHLERTIYFTSLIWIFNLWKLNFIQPEDFIDCNGTIASATYRYQKIYDLFLTNSGIDVENMEVREVKIQVKQCEIWPSLEMNETYELRILDKPHVTWLMFELADEQIERSVYPRLVLKMVNHWLLLNLNGVFCEVWKPLYKLPN